ncbi:MAG: CcmD family protein [Pseudomonadota bacterium]|nr:MAG: CcmD family protein [Pseudomonadota bacterium]
MQGTQTTTPSERSTEFAPVEGGPETTSAEALLVAAYLLMWAILLTFVLLSWLRQKRLDRRVAELERALGTARS